MAEAKENHGSYDKLFSRQPRKPFIAVNKRVFNAIAFCLGAALSVVSQTLIRLGFKRGLKAHRNLEAAMTLSTLFSFYTEPEYVFHNDKLMDLAKRMGKADQDLFPGRFKSNRMGKLLAKNSYGGFKLLRLKGT